MLGNGEHKHWHFYHVQSPRGQYDDKIKQFICTQTGTITYRIYKKNVIKFGKRSIWFYYCSFTCDRPLMFGDTMPDYSAVHKRIAFRTPNPSDVYALALLPVLEAYIVLCMVLLKCLEFGLIYPTSKRG